MKRVLTTAIAATAIIASTSAFAAHEGFYINGQIGYSIADMGTFTNTYIYDTSQDNKAYGASFGYNFSLNDQWLLGLDIEGSRLSHIDLEKAPGAVDTHEFTYLGIGPIVTFKTNDKVDLFAKIAIANLVNFDDNDYLAPGLDYDASGNSTTAATTIGAGYNVNMNWEIFTSYQHIFGQTVSKTIGQEKNKPVTFNNFYAGIQYNF